MRYTFEMSYHHNNPMPNTRLTVVATNDQEATCKALLRAIEHHQGVDFGLTVESLAPLFKSKHEEHILRGVDEAEEEVFVHVWRIYEDGAWNLGFGLGTDQPNSTSKHDNTWLKLVTKHPPKTKEDLAQAIEGLVYDIRALDKTKLTSIYEHILSQVEGV